MPYQFDNESVGEIVDYVRSGRLFSTPPDLQALEEIPCWIIDSFEVEEVYRYQDPDADDAMIDETMNWNDILGSSDLEYFDATCTWRTEERSLFDSTVQPIMSEMRSLLNQGGLGFLFGDLGASDVTAMIDSIIRHRAVCGVLPDHIKETMWSILKLGAIPCGWYGGEDGMLAVYPAPFGNFGETSI